VKLRICCENGHSDLLTVVSDPPRTDEEEARAAALMIDMLEWQANDSPSGGGCLSCGGRVTVTVEGIPPGGN
jgi:hypothetical protein